MAETCISEGCNNPRKQRVGRRVGYKECPSCYNSMKKYGITTPERDALLDKQGGKCKLCERSIHFKGRYGGTGKDAAVIDHQDYPFRVRGILCGQCNTSLGKLGDDEQGLLRALSYIKGEL